LPGAYEIMKKRWPEVVLIVFLQAGVIMLVEQVSVTAGQEAAGNGTGQLPTGIAFLLGMGTVAILIVAQMLYLGFLKTACTDDGTAPREPAVMLRIGRGYFWRMLRFQLIISVVWMALFILVVSVAGHFLAGGARPEDFPPWVPAMSLLLSLVVLIRPLVLSPALMVGCDMMALESIRATRRYRILGGPRSLSLCVLAMVVVLAVSVVLDMFEARGTLRYLVAGCRAVAGGTVWLAVHLEALRMVTFLREQDIAEQDACPDDDRTFDEQA